MNICREIWVYGFVWNLLSSIWKSIDVCTIVWVCLVGYRKYRHMV